MQLKIRQQHDYDKNKASKYRVLVESSNLNLGVVELMPTVQKPTYNLHWKNPLPCKWHSNQRVVERIGPIKYLRLISDVHRKSKGYIFCDFEDPADSDKSIMTLDKLQCEKLFLMVQKAK